MNDQEYLKAVKTLNEWAKAYYTLDAPIASDDEYDALYHKILESEKQNPILIASDSPTKRVGGEG